MFILFFSLLVLFTATNAHEIELEGIKDLIPIRKDLFSSSTPPL